MTYALLALGALLIIGSVGVLSLVAAGLVAGTLCLALGFGLWRSDQAARKPPSGSE